MNIVKRVLVAMILLMPITQAEAAAQCGSNWCDGTADTIFESFKTTTGNYVMYKLPLSLANYLTSCPNTYFPNNGWVFLYHSNANFMTLFPKLEQAILTGQSIKVAFAGNPCYISTIEVRTN